MSRRRSPLRYAWAMPGTLVGLALGGLATLLGARAAVVDGVLEFGGGRIGRVVPPLAGGARPAALTLGHVIVGVDCRALDSARAHEQVHVRQWERWGFFLYPAYLGSSLWQLIRRRSPYADNRFERQAREESRRG